jgi:hypothetical protein
MSVAGMSDAGMSVAGMSVAGMSVAGMSFHLSRFNSCVKTTLLNKNVSINEKNVVILKLAVLLTRGLAKTSLFESRRGAVNNCNRDCTCMQAVNNLYYSCGFLPTAKLSAEGQESTF